MLGFNLPSETHIWHAFVKTGIWLSFFRVKSYVRTCSRFGLHAEEAVFRGGEVMIEPEGSPKTGGIDAIAKLQKMRTCNCSPKSPLSMLYLQAPRPSPLFIARVDVFFRDQIALLSRAAQSSFFLLADEVKFRNLRHLSLDRPQNSESIIKVCS